MKSILTKSGKFSVVFACILLLAVSSMAQLTGPRTGNLKLRRAVDTDGDGKADLSVFRPSNNGWYTFKSGGGFSIQQFGIADRDYMTPGDYDGDGKGDLAVWRDTDGAWYILNSSNSTFSVSTFGQSGDEPIARDYDGDGKTDRAVVRRTGGAMIWYVQRSTDGGFSSVSFGVPTDFTAPGDYDGDGKFDYAVQRPGATATSMATFYISRSSDGGNLIAGWGFSTDIVVPGDYDGDGKTDLAVVREGATPGSAMAWYILKSSTNNNGDFLAYGFGSTGDDVPAQNDYDGDGKTDLAIWRNSTGYFWILQSSNSGVAAYQWGQSNDFPIAGYDAH